MARKKVAKVPPSRKSEPATTANKVLSKIKYVMKNGYRVEYDGIAAVVNAIYGQVMRRRD